MLSTIIPSAPYELFPPYRATVPPHLGLHIYSEERQPTTMTKHAGAVRFPPLSLLLPALLLLLLPLSPGRGGAATAAKVAVIPPIMFESHLYIFQRLAGELHARGHDVVFVVSEGRELPPSPHVRLHRYRGLFSSRQADEFLQEKVQNIFSGRLTSLQLLSILEQYERNCDVMVGDRDLRRRLEAERFDLLLIDPNEMCGFVWAHLLGVRYAVLSTGLWFPAEIGAPAPLAYVPEFNSELTDDMGPLERARNAVVYAMSRLGTHWLILPRFDAVIRRHWRSGGERRPEKGEAAAAVAPMPMAQIIAGTDFWMLCTDAALEFPRPTLPHVAYVGGVLTKPAGPLPTDLASWADAAGDVGFVIVSFGAGVKYLSEELSLKLAGAFARLPHKVLWRYFGEKPHNLGNNTRLVEWLPQNDLLGHVGVRAFVTHGGLNGVYEAVYHGVPVVGMPLFGDHYDTMTRVHAKGMGLKMHWDRMTQDDLYNAIVDVTSVPSYRERAQVLSHIHRDYPEHPVNRTVYWVEYVIRHGGAPHLRARLYAFSTPTYWLLDVALLFAVAVYACYRLGSWALSVCCRRRWRQQAQRSHAAPGQRAANGARHTNGVAYTNGVPANGVCGPAASSSSRCKKAD
uniref:2-hydroxyacylsphingosine 1-beta-galactosyltransferase isoform X1 n=2 Tax=Petromyzon marinus TaxID=7757 RepID=A0AAJ7X8C6_PETMA|nr:2-hydroxyacylsphingosine 1-beta-galactosyltransferase isoform X1 [Petromyzon marinus]